MHVLTTDIAGGIRWLADLLPLIGAVLGVLVLFELAILLGSVIATLEARSARAVPSRVARADDPDGLP